MILIEILAEVLGFLLKGIVFVALAGAALMVFIN